MNPRFSARLAIFLTIALIAAIALGLPGVTRPVSAQGSQDNVIKLGFIPVVIYAPLYVGIERGYFEQEGVKVELIPVPAGAGDSIIQLAAGNFDAAATGAGATFWNAARQNDTFRIVAPLHTERPPLSTPLVIAADRKDEIKQVSDLKGKKIAINGKGSAIEYWVYSALSKGGLTMGDVTIVTMPFPQMPQALVSKAIDAAVMTDPLALQAREQGSVVYLADDYINSVTVTYVFFGTKLLNERPQIAEAFMRAYVKALRSLQGDGWLDVEAAKAIEKFTKVPSEVILRINRPYFDPDGKIPMGDLDNLQRYFMGRGLLEYNDLMDIAPLVDSSLVEKAVAALGPYQATEATAAPTASR